MDARFTRKWRELEARRDAGEPFDRVIRGLPGRDLVESLAAAGGEDPVAANALATELLNRIHRARFAGAAIVAALVALGILAIDLSITGTWGVLEGPVGRVLIILDLAILAACGVVLFYSWVHWRNLASPAKGPTRFSERRRD